MGPGNDDNQKYGACKNDAYFKTTGQYNGNNGPLLLRTTQLLFLDRIFHAWLTRTAINYLAKKYEKSVHMS